MNQEYQTTIDRKREDYLRTVREVESTLRIMTIHYNEERTLGIVSDQEYIKLIKRFLLQIFKIVSESEELIRKLIDTFENIDDLLETLRIFWRPNGTIRVHVVHQYYITFIKSRYQ